MILPLRSWVLSPHGAFQHEQYAKHETIAQFCHDTFIPSPTAQQLAIPFQLLSKSSCTTHISKEQPKITQTLTNSVMRKWLKLDRPLRMNVSQRMLYSLRFDSSLVQTHYCYRCRRFHSCSCVKSHSWQNYTYVQQTPSHPGLKRGRRGSGFGTDLLSPIYTLWLQEVPYVGFA